MSEMAFRRRMLTLAALSLSVLMPAQLAAGPVVVPTAEGQIGQVPGLLDNVLGARFESVRGNPGDVILGRLKTRFAVPAPLPELDFLTDTLHDLPNPMPVATIPILLGTNIDKSPPASARSRNAADDGDFVAFSFATAGALPNTNNVRIATFDETGNTLVDIPVTTVDNAFPFPDPALSDTSVAVDNQGRVTIAYTELPASNIPEVRATRLDAVTGLPIDPDFLINPSALDVDVALLDPAGNRLIIATTEADIQANIVELSGPTPLVLPEFAVATTAAIFGNLNPQVAADPATGSSMIVWENISGLVGNPVDLFGRRFDAMGNPIGDDFRVNTTTANAQGQPAVAYGPQNLTAVVWSGDGQQLPADGLDVFLQVYDPLGNPIGGEIRVNTNTPGFQDQPAVRFLPEPDNQGRPQVMVAWRDVGQQDGSSPVGTGTSYKCFAINGFPDPEVLIFADGFESGDTSSWSQTQP